MQEDRQLTLTDDIIGTLFTKTRLDSQTTNQKVVILIDLPFGPPVGPPTWIEQKRSKRSRLWFNTGMSTATNVAISVSAKSARYRRSRLSRYPIVSIPYRFTRLQSPQSPCYYARASELRGWTQRHDRITAASASSSPTGVSFEMSANLPWTNFLNFY